MIIPVVMLGVTVKSWHSLEGTTGLRMTDRATGRAVGLEPARLRGLWSASPWTRQS
jgi:hypothetical protein